MKILSLFILPLSLFSYEISFSKKFTTELKPDVLSSNFRVQIEGDSERKVSSRLEVFNKVIKEFDKIEKKLGSFNVRPNYKYNSNNSPKITSYTGSLNYEISSTHANSINEFISKMNDLKNSRNTSIIINGLSWKITESSKNISHEVLRLESINWINTYASNLSKNLNTLCTTKKILINSNTLGIENRLSSLDFSSIKSSNISIPQSNVQEVSINANYILDCK